MTEKRKRSTGTGVIDWSKWNDQPSWVKADYRTNEERWADWGQAQREFMAGK